ncbi:MAG: type II secretion system protein [Sulfuricurvum sp.]|nr:type II secretion system protein [Sulfuricurvum sp.]MDD5385768.1 type II secretion system protein [Sulfuricurvum sp.]
MKRKAFTMIELVFVIVVLGILAAIAIPKFAATRDDAQIAKGRSDVAAIRAAIVSERQGRLMQGDSKYIQVLSGGSTGSSTLLFEGNGTSVLLQYGISPDSSNGHWTKTSDTVYVFHVMNEDNTFTYTPSDGKFQCSGTYCNQLTN